jgi:hypothetical protein
MQDVINTMSDFPDNSWVFVFGSNEAGRHGKGAAKTALIEFGAKLGVGVGHIGNSYAIPTKSGNLRTLSLYKIDKYVDEFITYASENPQLNFYVTEIGCGLAGYKPAQIAPMFNRPLSKNIHLPKSFTDVLCSLL